MQTKVHKANSSWTPANQGTYTFQPPRPFPTTETMPSFDSLQFKSEERDKPLQRFANDPVPSPKFQGTTTLQGTQTLRPKSTATVSRPKLPNILQRMCAECAQKEQPEREQDSSERTVLQAKLTIGEPGDKYEQEADQVARQVVQRMNSPQVPQQQEDNIQRQPNTMASFVQKKSDRDLKISEKPSVSNTEIDRRAVATNVPEVQADFESNLNSARGGGSPLDKDFRAKIEPAMGADFSGVRVHTDSNADQLNRSIQAKAFTTGQDVFFRQGEYNPHSSGGQELLAHELTHVVQQNSGKVQVQKLCSECEKERKEEKLQKKPLKKPLIPKKSLLSYSKAQNKHGVDRVGNQVMFISQPSIQKQRHELTTSFENNSSKVQRKPINQNTISFKNEQNSASNHFLIAQTTSPPQIQASFFGNSIVTLWSSLPQSIKIRYIDKAIDVASSVLQSTKKPQFGELWPFISAGLVGFLQRLKATPIAKKLLVMDKVIKLISGTSWQYGWGLLKGIVKGFFVDGLAGIFIAIYELIKGFSKLYDLLQDMSKIIGGFTEEIAEIINGFQQLTQEIVSQQAAVVIELYNYLRNPDNITAGINQIYQIGQSYASNIGKSIADKLIEFFLKPNAEEAVGEGVGRFLGMVTFEVVFAVLTSGVGVAVTGAKTAARFVAKITGKFVAGILKVLASIYKLFDPVIDLVKSLGKFVKGKVIPKVTEKLGNLLTKVKQILKIICENCINPKLKCPKLKRRRKKSLASTKKKKRIKGSKDLDILDITDQAKSGKITKPEGAKWKQTPNWEKWTKSGGKIKQHPDGSVTLIAKDGTAVKYSPDGYPDFKQPKSLLDHSSGVTEVKIDPPFSKSRTPDYKKANEKAGHPRWGDKPPKDYRWHHHQDGTTMQLVPKRIHTMFGHSGGVANL